MYVIIYYNIVLREIKCIFKFLFDRIVEMNKIIGIMSSMFMEWLFFYCYCIELEFRKC